jgi:hypothetical protein
MHRSMALLGTLSASRTAPPLATYAALDRVLSRVFAAVDADGSGSLSWREFLTAIETGMARAPAAAAPSAAPSGAAAATKGGAARGGAAGAPPAAAHAPTGPAVVPVPRLRFRPLTVDECRQAAQTLVHLAR